MTSALGFVNEKGGKTVLASGANTDEITVTLPNQGGVLLTSANGILPGTIQSFAFKVAPIGWLVCDGSTLKRNTYAELFSAIGTTFNTGGEAGDEFRIPNMGGQFLRGWVEGQAVDPGRVFGTRQEDGVGPISVSDPGHSHVIYQGQRGAYGGANPVPDNMDGGNYSNLTATTAKTNISIGGTIDETRPNNVAVLFCIFAGLTTQFYTTQSASSDTTPAGVVMYSAGQEPPPGWLVANGASLSQVTYAALFKAIGKTYGGDDTEFNLPDLRGEFVRGWDDGRNVDAGRVFGSSQTDLFENHSHTVTDPGHTHGNPGPCNNGGGTAQWVNACGRQGTVYSDYNTTGITIGDSTNGGAETRPRNVALLPIIKF